MVAKVAFQQIMEVKGHGVKQDIVKGDIMNIQSVLNVNGGKITCSACGRDTVSKLTHVKNAMAWDFYVLIVRGKFIMMMDVGQGLTRNLLALYVVLGLTGSMNEP